MEKNSSVFFFLIISGILILNPVTFSEIPESFGEENETDAEVSVGRALELSFLLSKDPEPKEVELSFEIKHGNDDIEISTITFDKENEEVIFEKNKYFETAYADFYFDEDSLEVVFQIYFSKALQITSFTVTATDADGDSSEIVVDKTINVKRAKKSITLNSIAEYVSGISLSRTPLSSIEYSIKPNPFGGDELLVKDGGIHDEDRINDGTVIITQIPTSLYNVTIVTSEITENDVELISKDPERVINVEVHSFNPTLTSVFREVVESGYEEPQEVDANFGEEFDDLLEAQACLIDEETGECVPISDPNELSFAIVGEENVEGINDLEPVQIVVSDDLVPDDGTLTIEDAENLLPTIITPDSELNQATLLPTLSIDDKKSDSVYAISSGVNQEDIQGNTVIVKVSEDTFEDGKGGVQQAIIEGAENLQVKPGNKPEVFSFKNSKAPGELSDGREIPRLPSLDNLLGLTNENNFETYIDVQTRYEQGNTNSVNWHEPENFESLPIIKIVIPAISSELAQTESVSGLEVFSMDSNDDMYLIPKPVIFILDETVDPPKWTQEGVKIIHDSCKRIGELHAACDAEFPHFSKFAIGGVKSLALGSLYLEKHSDDENTRIKAIQENQTSIEIQPNELPEESLPDTNEVEPVSEKSNGEVTIPNWIRQPGYWWISGLIGDDEFKNSIKYGAGKGIIQTSTLDLDVEITVIEAKNKVWDWSEGLIDDDEMNDVINWLIRDEV